MRTDMNKSGNGMRRKKTRIRINKVRLLIFCLFLALTVGITGYIIVNQKVNDVLENVDIVETPEGNAAWGIDDDVAASLSEYQTIAILGVDDYTNKGDNFAGTRTDAILIASINKETNEVKLLSVMRDTYLEIQDEDEQYFFAKVNHAHFEGGPMDTCRALNRNLDLNITEFVVFNWKSIADLVDAVGGIDLDVSEDELKDMNIDGESTGLALGKTYQWVLQTGIQHLDGVQATTYCRIRKNSGGDEARAERTREAMMEILKKAKELDLASLKIIARDVLPQVRTNVTKDNMVKYMMKVNSYEILASQQFPSEYWGGLIDEVWYAVPQTLETNVTEAHRFLYGQEGYLPSDTSKGISDDIIRRSGVDI